MFFKLVVTYMNSSFKLVTILIHVHQFLKYMKHGADFALIKFLLIVYDSYNKCKILLDFNILF